MSNENAAEIDADIDNEDIEPGPEPESDEEQGSVDEKSDDDKNGEEGEPEEVTVSIGDEEQEEQETNQAPQWVKDLRREHRELKKRNRELEEAAKANAAPEKIELGKKPTLEDHEFDTDAYEAALTAWYDRKREYEAQQESKKKEEEDQQKAWQAKVDAYTEKKESLKVPDYDEAEAEIDDVMSQTQRGIIIAGADNPALVIYALGKNQKKAKELASITDHVKFAVEIGKLETQLKVTGKRTPPPPEGKVGGTAPISGTTDSTLERLRAEADKTGDRTKVLEYMRRKKSQ